MADKKLSPVVKGIIWVGVIAAVGVSGYVAMKLYTRWKDKKDKEKLGVPDTTSDAGLGAVVLGNTPKTCKHCVKDAAFPLKKGSQGKQVAAVQYAYNVKFPNNPITVDGDWGRKTEDAFASIGVNSFASFVDSYGAMDFAWKPKGSASTAGSGASAVGVKIEKNIYDKYFKGFEQY